MFFKINHETTLDAVNTYFAEINIPVTHRRCDEGAMVYLEEGTFPPDAVAAVAEKYALEPVHVEHGVLTSKKYREKTMVSVGRCVIGGAHPVFIAGPCAVESESQLMTTAKALKASGVDILRGGAFKPRTSPYSFQGLGRRGIELLCEAKKAYDMPIISEIVDIRDLDLFLDSVDIVQVGARNMQNMALLKELGRTQKPIFLKRGISATIKEWLLCAEYILHQGNENVILCERGIRTFEPYTRNTMDISAIALLKTLSHLPVIADPSHATGIRQLIEPMTLASLAAGADGVMIEAHCDPDNALSDGGQSILPEAMQHIIEASHHVSNKIVIG